MMLARAAKTQGHALTKITAFAEKQETKEKSHTRICPRWLYDGSLAWASQKFARIIPTKEYHQIAVTNLPRNITTPTCRAATAQFFEISLILVSLNCTAFQ
jgi:hypothetical protein